MNNQEFKQRIIEELNNREAWVRKVNQTEYKTRCPFCGDSQHNKNKGRLYIKIDLENNFPIVYNCFKCNEHGVLTRETLEALSIVDEELLNYVDNFNKSVDDYQSTKFLNNVKSMSFDYSLPEIVRGNKTKYIEDRLGASLSDEELRKFKVITSLKGFLESNNIKKLMCPIPLANNIEHNYVGFLTYGSAYIMFRDITNKEYYRWIKYPISKDSQYTKLFYSIESAVDIFTKENIIENNKNAIIRLNITESGAKEEKLNGYGIRLIPQEFIGNDELTGLRFKNTQDESEFVVNTNNVFVAIGQVPHNEPFKDLVELDKHGFVITNDLMETNVPGIFAVGDTRKKDVRQVITALGDASVAAVMIDRYLRNF